MHAHFKKKLKELPYCLRMCFCKKKKNPAQLYNNFTYQVKMN